MGNLLWRKLGGKDFCAHRYSNASEATMTEAEIKKLNVRGMFADDSKERVQFASDLLEIIDCQTP
jgi:hypothetical protein